MLLVVFIMASYGYASSQGIVTRKPNASQSQGKPTPSPKPTENTSAGITPGKFYKSVLCKLGRNEVIEEGEYDFNMKINGCKYAIQTYDTVTGISTLIVNGKRIISSPVIFVETVNLNNPQNSTYVYAKASYSGNEFYISRYGQSYGPFRNAGDAFEYLGIDYDIWKTNSNEIYNMTAWENWNYDGINLVVFDKTKSHVLVSNWDNDFVIVDGKKIRCQAPFFAFYDDDSNSFAWISQEGDELVMYTYKPV